MSDSERPSLRDEQKALTRRRLLDGAEAVFARSGFHGASVEEIAREAGATSGALYSNFASKEDLFLALFEERIATDVGDYSQIVADGATLEQQARGAADHWMGILRQRPDYFPLLIEFWAYAIREPQLRVRLAERFAALRSASARLVLQGAQRQGFPPNAEAGEFVGQLINALGNGLALEKLTDPDAVPDGLFGDMLVVIFQAFEALMRENSSMADPANAGSPQELPTEKCKESKMTEDRPTAGSGVPTGRFADPDLRPATVEDVHRLSAVLAEAFFEDPVFGWLMPKDSKRLAQLRRYFGLDLGHYALPRGRVWTTNDLTGAALTLPPGEWRVPPRTTLLHGSAFGIHLPRAARMGAAMEWRHTREVRGPHYYVRDIGVHPDMQGRGLGSVVDAARRSSAATGRACPPTSRPPASATPRCTSASASDTSKSCVSVAARRCG